MYAATSPSDREGRSADIVPIRRWADGAAEVSVGLRDGETHLRHLYQSDPCRALFPRTHDGAPMEAVIVTTSGGIVGGDRLRFALDAGPGATAVFTTQAAEKVYRSAGAEAEIDVVVRAHDGAVAEWMPQETILFDGARLRRRTRLYLDGSARLLAGEIVVFGRRARGEVFTQGFLHDAWRIWRGEKLVWADALRLDDDVAARLADRHAFASAAAVATFVYAAPDAAAALETARELLGDTGRSAAATVVGDLLIVRFVDPDADALRRRFTGFWGGFRSAVAGLPARLPRVWEV